ncbi:MAG: hypothetical protein QOJ47_1397, partial [Gaiellales bacterium]|nr:hypothetical protein [Gaiellales bacterium]
MFTLEVIWLNATVFAFARSSDGSLADGGLESGSPAEIHPADRHVVARRLSVEELLALAADPPDLVPGDTARAVFALVDLAQRAVQAGLVHPQLVKGGSSWYAFWGATLDEGVQAELDAIAAAAPPVTGELDELYPQLVDHLARARLIEADVRLTGQSQLGRSQAVEAMLRSLAASEPDLPAGPTYRALARRLEHWVDLGLQQMREAHWRLGLHLDERPGRDALALELWLHAGDDPTLSLPASLLWQGGDGFAFVREGDPYTDLDEQLAELAPLLATGGIAFDEEEPSEVSLDTEDVSFFLRELMPSLEERGVPVVLPSAWVRAPARIRANVSARIEVPSSGLLITAALATFDWRLAVGDVDLTEAQLIELAAA